MYYVSIKYNYLIYTFVDFVSRSMFRLDFVPKYIIMLIAPLSVVVVGFGVDVDIVSVTLRAAVTIATTTQGTLF